MTSMSCNPFSEPRMSPLSFQKILFSNNNRILLWNFVTWCLLMLCTCRLRSFTIPSHRNPINSFERDWRKRSSHLYEIEWKTWRVEKFCVFIVQKLWLFQSVQDRIFLREWIQCFYNNAIDRLFMAKSQSINDRREQMLHLDTSQIALIRDPNVY